MNIDAAREAPAAARGERPPEESPQA